MSYVLQQKRHTYINYDVNRLLNVWLPIIAWEEFPLQETVPKIWLSLLVIKSLKGDKSSDKTGTFGHILDSVDSYGKSYFREI